MQQQVRDHIQTKYLIDFGFMKIRKDLQEWQLNKGKVVKMHTNKNRYWRSKLFIT
jgi:hypothetical protein